MQLHPIEFVVNELFAANISNKVDSVTIEIEDIKNLEKQANILFKVAIQHAYLSGAFAANKNCLDANFYNKYYENDKK